MNRLVTWNLGLQEQFICSSSIFLVMTNPRGTFVTVQKKHIGR